MKIVDIERRSAVDAAEFERECAAGRGRPVIVTDAAEKWPALRKWTFAYFRERYGFELVPLSDRLGSPYAKLTRLSAFIDHLTAPASPLPGFWVDFAEGRPLLEPPVDERCAYYLLDWRAFQKHPELVEDIQLPLYFVEDWEAQLDSHMREALEKVSARETTSLYIGAPGTLSSLHQDFWGTHGCLVQLQGRKEVMLFAPGEAQRIYEGDVDPGRPDYDRFPRLREATALRGEIGPGDTLFIPSRWWHWVRGLDSTMTVSRNFFNATNFGDHLRALARKDAALARQLSEKFSRPGRANA